MPKLDARLGSSNDAAFWFAIQSSLLQCAGYFAASFAVFANHSTAISKNKGASAVSGQQRRRKAEDYAWMTLLLVTGFAVAVAAPIVFVKVDLWKSSVLNFVASILQNFLAAYLLIANNKLKSS